MDRKKEWTIFSVLAGAFLIAYFLPVGTIRFDRGLLEGFHLLKWYAREHVVLCLIPAFFIAGAISVFVSQNSVMKYLGAKANKVLAYGVASVSGTILAVCSCTVLPLFAGIWKMGAGLGPASAFLYSGPAINVLAIFLTARVLGLEMGIARVVGAVLFSVVVGILMHLAFRKEEDAKAIAQIAMPDVAVSRALWKNVAFMASMVSILVFANWGQPGTNAGVWFLIFKAKWILTSVSAVFLGVFLYLWFGAPAKKLILAGLPAVILAVAVPSVPLLSFGIGSLGLAWLTATSEGELFDWFKATWDFAKQITPLLLMGVLAAGIFLGRPGQEGLIPSVWVQNAVGGNSLMANFLSSIIGAFMYFATLTEIPILQGLMGSGMGKGPALALLLAGPALSLPSMLVLRSIMGTKKTVVYVSIVVVMATGTGWMYGFFF